MSWPFPVFIILIFFSFLFLMGSLYLSVRLSLHNIWCELLDFNTSFLKPLQMNVAVSSIFLVLSFSLFFFSFAWIFAFFRCWHLKLHLCFVFTGCNGRSSSKRWGITVRRANGGVGKWCPSTWHYGRLKSVSGISETQKVKVVLEKRYRLYEYCTNVVRDAFCHILTCKSFENA